MNAIFRIIVCCQLIFLSGIDFLFAQCGGANTIEFQGVQKVYNTACGNNSYQNLIGTNPTGSGNSIRWEVSFSGGAYTEIRDGSGIPLNDRDLSKTEITNFVLTPAGNASGDYRIRRIVTNAGAGCSNTSQPVFLYYAQSAADVKGGTITGNLTGCSPASGVLTVSGNTGPVLRWESSTDSGVTWAPVANTTNTLNYTNLTSATCFRARIDNICDGNAGTIDPLDPYSTTVCITINSVPTITAQPLSQGVCIGAGISMSVAATSATPLSYQWRKNGFEINGANSASFSIASVSNTDAGSYDVVITNSCGAVTSTPAVVTVNPAPVAIVPSNSTVCPGGAVSATSFSSSPAGATFSWTNSNTAIGLAASGSGNVPAFTATNSTTSAITSTITVTPILNGCAGPPSSYTITVNPTAVVAVPASFAVCEGAVVSATNFSSTPTGASYTWTNSNTSIGLAANGSGNIPSFTVTGSGTATITVTPTLNGCQGTSSSYVITVNPLPIVSANATDETNCGDNNGTVTVSATGAGPLEYSIDGGATYPSASGVFTDLAPGSYAVMVRSSTGCVTTGPIVTVASPGAPPKPDIDTTNSPVCEGETIVASVQTPIGGATYTWTGPGGYQLIETTGTMTRSGATQAMGGNYVVTVAVGGCVSTAENFVIVVKRRPTVNQPSNLTYCAGVTVPATSFISTPAGATYSWTNSNNSIGLGLGGPGQVPSFTAVNNTSSPITATIRVTPRLNDCDGIPVVYTITINPIPLIDPVTDKTACHGGIVLQQDFTSNVAGTTFSWTVAGLGATFSGSGSIPSFTAVNYGTSPIVGTVTVTANAAGCSGASEVYTITVNPLPRVINAPLNQTTCAGTNTAEVVLTSDVAGATFSWTASASNGITGFTPSGTGNIPVEFISNSGTTQGTVTYTIFATANGCTGPATSYVIRVDPLPKLLESVVLSQTVCSGSATATVNLSSEVTGTLFNWTAVSSSGSVTGFQSTGTGQTQIPSQIIFNSGTTAGTVTYTIVPVSDGCSGPVSTYTITVNPLPTATISGNATVCYGANAVLNVTLTGTSPWSITYSDGTTFTTVSGITTNSYNLTVSATTTKTYTIESVSDASSCANFGVGSATITQPTAPLTATGSRTNVTCFGAKDGTITFVNATGGSGTYDYSIDGGTTWQSGVNFTALSPGSYVLQVRDAANVACKYVVNAALVISEPSAALTAVMSDLTNVLCFGASTGSARVTASGGTAPYSFQWSNGTTLPDLTNVPAGTYTVTVSDTNGCVIAAALSVTITQPASALNARANSTNVSCFGGQDGTITISNVTGGSGNYEFSINGGTSWRAASTFTNLTAGSYYVLVRDASAPVCVLTVNASLLISEPSAALSASASSINVTCFGTANGSITFTGASGGTAPYSYSINNGVSWQTGTTFTGLAPGTYSLQVRDAANCSYQVNSSLTITQPSAALTASISGQTNVLCFGASSGSASVSAAGGTAPYSYLWSNGYTSADLKNVPAGTYTVNVSDANGCTIATALSVTITQPDALAATATAVNVRCFGGSDGSITLVSVSGGSGAYEYSINGGASWQSGATFTNLIAGSYHVQVRDTSAPACVLTVNEALIISQLPALTATVASSNVTCFGGKDGSITISNISGGSGAYQYSIGGGSWQNGNTFPGVGAGSYIVQVRDAINPTCVLTINESLLISQPTVLAANVVFTNITCRGSANGSISVTNSSGGSGNYEYSIKGGSNWQSNPLFNNLPPGIYNVQMRDLSNPACTMILGSAVEIRQAAEPLVSGVTSFVNVNCFGSSSGAITLSVKGGVAPYKYFWSNGATTRDLSNVPAGTYTVAVTDSYNCVINHSVTITQPSQPISISFTKNDVTCFGSNNGRITLTPTGGSAPYTYSWSNGRTTKDLTNLAPGSYTISVTDAKGCKSSQQILINQPAQALAAKILKTNITCFNASDGKIELSVTGGTAPYSYSWSSGQKVSSLTGVAPGTYSVTITDANGCTIRESVSITQPSAPLRMAFTIKNTVCKSSSDGTIAAAISGGIAPYTITWKGRSQTSTLITGLSPGSYDITVRDAMGCTLTANALVASGVCAPVAVDDIFKIYEGNSAEGTTASNDFDRDNDKLTFSLTQQPKNGIVVFNSDGTFTYKPNAGFVGTETMPYKICNTSGVCSSANLIIRVVTLTTVNLTPALSNVREGKKVSVTAMLEKTFPYDVFIKIGYSGNAIKDRDYVLLDQFIEIMIPKGQLGTTEKITIAALTDDANEGDETLDIQILSTSDPDVRVGTGAVVTINDVYPPDPIEIENKEIPINPDISTNPLFSPNDDGLGNDVFNIVNIVSFPDNEVLIFNRWGNEVFRMKGYNESDRVFKGYANTGLLTNTNSPLPDGVYYYLITTRRTINGQQVRALNKGYLILKR